VKDLTSRHPEIERVVLFGSLARGEAVPGSDADLLLVLRDSKEPFLERCARYHPAGVGVDTDIIAYTRQELAQLQAEGNGLVAQALKEGLVLFDFCPGATPHSLEGEEAP